MFAYSCIDTAVASPTGSVRSENQEGSDVTASCSPAPDAGVRSRITFSPESDAAEQLRTFADELERRAHALKAYAALFHCLRVGKVRGTET